MRFSNKLPRVIGWGFFFLWIVWNVHWLSNGRMAPSALRHYFGVPVPSTGMTRSLFALLEGDWKTSLCWNVFTVPLFLLFALSIAWLVLCLFRRAKVVLPAWLGISWLAVLVMAQLSKWILGPEWW